MCVCVYNLRPKSTLRLRVQNDLLISRVRLFVVSPPRKRVIQKKSEMTKKATLSDTENLAVGAAGGILETGIQSTFCFRSHALFRTFVCVLIDHCCC